MAGLTARRASAQPDCKQPQRGQPTSPQAPPLQPHLGGVRRAAKLPGAHEAAARAAGAARADAVDHARCHAERDQHAAVGRVAGDGCQQGPHLGLI